VATLPALSPAGGVPPSKSGDAWWSSAWALLAGVVFVGVCGGLIGRLSRTGLAPVVAPVDQLGGGDDPDD
jgi:hypothetical protein